MSSPADIRFNAIDAALVDLAEVAGAQTRLSERIVELLTAPSSGNDLTDVMRNIERLLQELLTKLDDRD